MHSTSYELKSNLKMHRIRFNYSLKNIGLPSHHQYQLRLIEKVESVVQRMRWKAHFFLGGDVKRVADNKFGLPSKHCALAVTEMKAFEDDIIKMVSNVKFRKVEEPFLNNVAEDLKKVNSSENILIFADKTKNIYETTCETYNKLMTENITKTYKLGNDSLTEDINAELKNIANKVSIADRVDMMAKKNAFITLKDHKDNFDSHPKCRLINPSKSELGKVSKAILDDINSKIRLILNVNQWKNTQSVIDWFQSIKNKPNHSFLSFVGLFILNKLSAKFGQENVSLYQDDGLLLLNGTAGRLADRARKDLHEIFHQLDLKITAEINNHIANLPISSLT